MEKYKWKWWYVFFSPLMIVGFPLMIVLAIAGWFIAAGVNLFCDFFSVELPAWAVMPKCRR
jgi:hypothetical protein